MNLTDRERDFMQRVLNGGALRLADREEDKVRQKVRRAGFAVVKMQPRRHWEITESGKAVLA